MKLFGLLDKPLSCRLGMPRIILHPIFLVVVSSIKTGSVPSRRSLGVGISAWVQSVIQPALADLFPKVQAQIVGPSEFAHKFYHIGGRARTNRDYVIFRVYICHDSLFVCVLWRP
jgi:hypothetical protein